MRRRIPAPLGRTSALGDAASKRPAPAEVRLVVAQGMRLALLGLAIGLAAAFLATRLMAKLLYGVSATDAVMFGTVALLLGVIALPASWLPARRAVLTDRTTALRAE